MRIDEHPTVKRFREKGGAPSQLPVPDKLDAKWIRGLVLEAGADDVGLVEVDRPELADQRKDILTVFPQTKTLVSFVCRLNRENIRCVSRSVSNLEFLQTFDEVNGLARKVLATLDKNGIRALNPSSGFPMDLALWPGKMWPLSHKPIAVAAGLGCIGCHRLMNPLQDKEETVYVVPGSGGETHAIRRFPHKTIRRVGSGLRPNLVQTFLGSLPLIFQRDQSEGLSATYHFTFTGEEECNGTVVIRDKTIEVKKGHVGTADLHVTADSRIWIDFLAKERNLLWALIRRNVRIHGSPRLLKAFARCFPS